MTDALLTGTGVAVIAHRGGARLHPENTLLAFDHARDLGVDGFELDVHLSQDGEPVVIHDATLDRTTDARGPVAARTAAELAQVDAGFHFDPEGGFPFQARAGGVPRLAEVLERYATMPVIIEIKGNRPEVAERAIAVVREVRAQDRVIVAGFSSAVMTAARRLAPELPTSAAREEGRAAIRRSYFWLRPKVTGYRAFLVPFEREGRRFPKRFVYLARRAGIPVHAWTVNHAKDMRLLASWGVKAILTDNPDIALEIRERENWRIGD